MPKLPLSKSGLKLKKLLEERVAFLDGAMGTRNPNSAAAFRSSNQTPCRSWGTTTY